MRRLSNPLVLALVAASLVVAAGRAAAVTYIIEVQSGGSGTVTPSGVVEVPAGGSQTFTFTPGAGQIVYDVMVDDVSVGSGLTEYTFTNVQSDHVLYVSFAPPPPRPTTTTLDVRPVSGQCAVPETLTATVSDADGGLVQFFMGADLLGTRTLQSGTATYILTPGLFTGSYAFSARYLGTSGFDPSSSPAVPYDVVDTGPTPWTLTLTISSTIVSIQHVVGSTATLRIGGAVASTQSGQVTYYDGATVLGTVAMASGHSGGSFSMNTAGIHVLTAVAHPTQCVAAVTSEPETLLVIDDRTPTSMTLTISPPQVDVGGSVLLTAIVNQPNAFGLAHFLDVTNGVEVGTAQVVDAGIISRASFTYGPLSGSSRTMQAQYDGDSGYQGCTSNQAFLQVGLESPPGWGANGTVYAIVLDGSTIYIGGQFTQVGPAGAMQPRNYFAALDATTGAVTPWNPGANGAVYALAVSGGTVYAGGNFTSIGGQPRNGIAALDAATGSATAWNPNAVGAFPDVLALAVSGGTVYAGGAFYSIGGQSRTAIAALDAQSGAATAWNPHAITGGDQDAYVSALVVSAGTVYVGGDFVSIGGQPRNMIAALDTASGAATTWNPNARYTVDPDHEDPFVSALAVSEGTVYAGGHFLDIGGQPRNYIAALDTVSGAATTWNPNLTGVSVYALAVSGGRVYAGGDFTSIGGQPRNHIAALDAATGAATAWNPNADGPAGERIYVSALAVSGGTVFAGGSFTTMGGQPQPHIAALSADDIPVATLLAQFDATTSTDGIELRWSFGDPSQVASVAIERAPATAGPWLPIAPELRDESGVTVALDRTADERGQYFYRLVVQLTGGGQTVFGPVSASQRATLSQSELTLLSPNPTSGGTQVRYGVARAGRVRLELLDVSGRVEETLADRIHTPGRYVVTWDGVGRHGRLAPGLHFVRFVAPDQEMVGKLAIIR